ncbi:MAG: zinc-binding dehydrogenase, partial [Planctomycetota bacterium]
LAGCRFAILDVNAKRLGFCKEKMGIATTILAHGGPEDIAAIREAGGGNLPTVVIDATGHPRAMERSLEFLAFTGRMVYVGIVPDPIAVPDPLFHRREMTIMGSRNALPGDFRRIIDLIRKGSIDTRPWISHTVGFEEVPERFDQLTRPETGVIKAIINLDSVN